MPISNFQKLTPSELKRFKRVPSTSNKRQFAKLVKLFGDRPNIVSEGDSWFDYPSRFLSGNYTNIIDHIQSRTKGRANFLRMESNGDEITQMMSAKQRHSLSELLKKYAGKGQPISVLFYSGGGNDIVGPYDMLRFLNPYQAGYKAADCINYDALEHKLKQIELAFVELMSIRNLYSPDTVIISHTYDIPFITGKPAKYLGLKVGGPWISPAMKEMGIRPTLWDPITKLLFKGIEKNMLALPGKHEAKGKFLVAKTTRTLKTKSQWLNEIHPTSKGFGLIAKKVYAQFKAVMPDFPAWD
jgi:hypothetical protein